MADSVTKKDLEEVLDKKLVQYQGAILEAVDYKFKQIDAGFKQINQRFDSLERRMDEFDQKLDKLTTTLDNLFKKITDYDDELAIVKGDIKQIKKIIKEKLGIEISAVGW